MKQRDVDILFIQGNKSHAFGTWRMITEEMRKKDGVNVRLWYTELLEKELKKEFPHLKINTTFSSYETQALLKDILDLRIHHYEVHEVAERLGRGLKELRIGEKPVIVLMHSMGGLVLKYILTGEDQEFSKKLQK